MNTVFANQTPSSIKNQNTAHYHLIQMKWNQLWHLLELRRLIERFRNERLRHELQNEWNLLYLLVISFDCGVFFWYDCWLSRSLLLLWVNVLKCRLWGTRAGKRSEGDTKRYMHSVSHCHIYCILILHVELMTIMITKYMYVINTFKYNQLHVPICN